MAKRKSEEHQQAVRRVGLIDDFFYHQDTDDTWILFVGDSGLGMWLDGNHEYLTTGDMVVVEKTDKRSRVAGTLKYYRLVTEDE